MFNDCKMFLEWSLVAWLTQSADIGEHPGGIFLDFQISDYNSRTKFSIDI